jgi:hypothetical protein
MLSWTETDNSRFLVKFRVIVQISKTYILTMEQLVRIPCSNSLTSVTPFSIADILMTRGQEALERAQAQAQDQALDMTRKPAGKLQGE